ncbi:BcPKS17, polyketide synthase [Xylaria nigripes]|nr:BcPKS17, polyketide synthase [Xylaria nigripes]
MLVGAFVDAKDASMNERSQARSHSVTWNLDNGLVILERILAAFPQAYISVVQDERRVTVTAPAGDIGQLIRELEPSGFSVIETGQRGYFHWGGLKDELDSAIQFCDSSPEFNFIQCSNMNTPSRSTVTGEYFGAGALHHHILSSILVERCDWRNAFEKLLDSLDASDMHQLTYIGPESCVPVFVRHNPLLKLKQVHTPGSRLSSPVAEPGIPKVDLGGDHVAVVGMACQLPGAADIDEFWSLLVRGESQHTEVPALRFGFDTPWRRVDRNGRKWYGNFLEDYDKFDERFFGKSARESMSTDPQHRLMLQVAYQAVEQSGYFKQNNGDNSIGCYIGVGLGDYERNVGCQPATAYTAVGNLRAFAAGKISHYFGWSGPSLTIDTACSSSAVAIHTACKAILSGDCASALAGGVNVMTSPEWFQNLAAASFLSPSGQCKPFDSEGNGYCRGEAVGAVFLKRLSTAVADGDKIFGVIAASSVLQNQTSTAITVPSARSLSHLFGSVIQRSNISPKDISYVEAHGTGTPVGDPIEYESIRRVLGGDKGCGNVSLGSVKGLLGHSEAASGVVALLKVLLMVHHRFIPPQASFRALRVDMGAAPSDNITIAKSPMPWETRFKAALINNYGASGSNAALVVTQHTHHPTMNCSAALSTCPRKYPVAILALDDEALRRAAQRLVSFMKSNTTLSPADIAFQLVRQSNWTLPRSLVFNFETVTELTDKLSVYGRGKGEIAANDVPVSQPLILCFGGQTSRYIGLDRGFYDGVKILRKHLDDCNEICKTLGTSIYPGIFQKTPLQDIVALHLALFSLQYSCARSWIDCGARVAAVVGHSFGELVALCISGILSHEDALTVVAGRARLIRDYWGTEKGRMVAMRGNLRAVEQVLAEAHQQCKEEPAATIACFNAERSFTIAGSTRAIDSVLKIASRNSVFHTVDAKLLDVTNAFHCRLVDPVVSRLQELTQNMVFNNAIIHVEHATEYELNQPPSRSFPADHLRKPVYFHHAIQRLSQRFPSCVWLEAGSSSSITRMASSALQSVSANHFQSINITADNSFQNLVEATTNLWRQGQNISFWPHNMIQADEYQPVLLPPYQFQKARHWMELKKPDMQTVASSKSQLAAKSDVLWSLSSGASRKSCDYQFKIATDSEKFKKILNGHIIIKAYPICPSTFQLSIVIEALQSLREEYVNGKMQPRLRGMNNYTPMVLNTSREAWFDTSYTENGHVWNWKMFSRGENSKDPSVLHASGTVEFCSALNPETLDSFARYERLIRRSRCLNLLDSWDADEIMQGKSLYRAFSSVVEYGDMFCGVQKIVGKADESAGRIKATYSKDLWFDFTLADCFCQVAGIYVNTIGKKRDDEVFISDKIEQWFRSPRANYSLASPAAWEVYACHHQPSEREFLSDIFVFDSNDGALLEIIIGVHYLKVTNIGLRAAVAKTADRTVELQGHDSNGSAKAHYKLTATPVPLNPVTTGMDKTIMSDTGKNHKEIEITSLKEVVANLTGLKADQISDSSCLADVGIDSLTGIELARDIESVFKCTIELSAFQQLVDFRDLKELLLETLGISDGQNGIHVQDARSEDEDTLVSDGHLERIPDNLSDASIQSHQETMKFPPNLILETFSHFKLRTDDYIVADGFDGYVDNVLPKLDSLSIAYIRDAFEQLGSSFGSIEPGRGLAKIPHLPRHGKFVALLYDILEKKTGAVQMVDTQILRTTVPVPSTTAVSLLKELREIYPAHRHDYDLIEWTSTRLADCLVGKAEGLQLLFGTSEGKQMSSAMYGESPINVVWINQIRDFLRHLVASLPRTTEALKILEVGAGTGGTTARLIPALLGLGVPIQYTITDISSSLVGAARKRFKQHDFLEYRVFDVEAPVPSELLNSQHIVLTTNCIHAAHNIADATKHLREILRPDGFLVMLEMTQPVAWIDLIYGLLDGWWRFDDGRSHALVTAPTWRDTLQRSGFGHVEWTEGDLPESGIQRFILAMACGSEQESNEETPSSKESQQRRRDIETLNSRQAVIDTYVRKFAADIFNSKKPEVVPDTPLMPTINDDSSVVMITGATGSLGCHLVQCFAENPTTRSVICLNRRHTTDGAVRQEDALRIRGIQLSSDAASKLRVFQADTFGPNLGLEDCDYEYLAQNVTHIVVNAWPMSITRSIDSYVAQFEVMRNLLVLARDAHERLRQRGSSNQIIFQFISSIAVVGLDPLRTGNAVVREERMSAESALPNGYSEAKLVCEHMLEETLGRYPNAFRSMTVRLGQVAGSSITGYWNPVEHFPLLLKSAQNLGALPQLTGVSKNVPPHPIPTSRKLLKMEVMLR